MKRIFATLILSIAACTGLCAATTKEEVRITGQKIEYKENKINISMTARIDKHAARGGRTLVFAPVITDGTNRWSLPAIIVQGRKARIANMRHDWAGKEEALKPAFDEGAIVARRGASVAYETSLESQPWMDGASLEAEIIDMGCCSFTGGNVLLGSLEFPKPEPEIVIVPLPSTGERLAKERTWIVPFDGSMTFDGDRDNSLVVSFRQGSSVIDPAFAGNDRVLREIIRSVHAIQASHDSRVKNIMVAGFASPEGGFIMNERLSFDRSAALRRYIIEHTGLAGTDFTLHGGGEDWDGLRIEVERSNMLSKGQVLTIIDEFPVRNDRTVRALENELMRLDGGQAYRYMYQHFYPKLRNAAYIKIYYENK